MGKGKKRKLQHATSKPFKANLAPKRKQKASKPPNLPPPTPFNPFDRILLIGEGDFSFASSLVTHHACYELTATCYDSQESLFEKYTPQAEEHTKLLEDHGQTVLYSVDATKLDTNKSLKNLGGGLFNTVLFNFPHVGGKSTDVNRQVRFNQELLVKFFTSCQPLLAPEGTIAVTLFEGEPYTLWNIRDLARHTGLEVVRSFKFQAEEYPGYKHARTLGNIEGGGGWKGEDREARSYVFRKKDGGKGESNDGEKQAKAGAGKRKRGKGGESSDEEG